MPDYVIHMERKRNPNFSLCGKSVYTAHIRTTKDIEKVTCSKCKKRMDKHKIVEILDTVSTGKF